MTVTILPIPHLTALLRPIIAAREALHFLHAYLQFTLLISRYDRLW
jgi:hypothetical protein